MSSCHGRRGDITLLDFCVRKIADYLTSWSISDVTLFTCSSWRLDRRWWVLTLTWLSFFLNNQPDTLIIEILFCYKILHVSDNLFVHHQEFSTVHSALVSFKQAFDDRFQAELGWNWDGFGGLVVSMLASGWVQTRPKPLDFSDVKILSMPSSWGEVKESVPCPSFAACQRT